MTLEFGHGFIPRIGEENYKAVDRCVGPADLFSERPLEVPWAIVDGAWAAGRPDLLATLRENGTRLLADTHAWRYRYPASQQIKKLATASWAPVDGLLNLNDPKAMETFFRESLTVQADLNVDAYLLPGWMPKGRTEDLRGPYERVFEWASSINDIPAKPFVQFVGGHSQGSEITSALIDETPHFVSTVYLQISPVSPLRDGPSKLEGMLEIYRRARERGFQVIAGHCGAIAPALKALGIDAADSGLATAETFDRSRAARPPRPKSDGESSAVSGGRGARIYLAQIGLSLGKAELDRLLEVPAVAAELQNCRLPCHRFRGGNLIDRAREHSLYARVEDAQLIVSLPPSMRATAVHERLQKQRSTIAVINGALENIGGEPINKSTVENHLAWVARSLTSRSAA